MYHQIVFVVQVIIWFVDVKLYGVLDWRYFVRHFLPGTFAMYHGLNIVVLLFRQLILIATS
jgi:hypothetical protein